MEVIGTAGAGSELNVNALAVGVFKGEKANDGLSKTLDAAVGGAISDAIATEEFTGKEAETAYFHVSGSGVKAKRVLLIGCGERTDYNSAQITQMAGTAARFLRGKNSKTIAIVPRADGDAEKIARTVVVGAIMGVFEPDKYRTKDKEEREIESLSVVVYQADK